MLLDALTWNFIEQNVSFTLIRVMWSITKILAKAKKIV